MRWLIVITLLLLATPSQAALAYVQGASQTGAASVAVVTLGVGATTDNLVVGGTCSNAESQTLTSVVGTGMTFVTLGPYDHSGASNVRCYQVYALGASSQTVFTFTWSGSVEIFANLLEFSGNANPTVQDAEGNGEGTAAMSHDITGTGTTTWTHEVLICTISATSLAAYTAGTSYTIPSGVTVANGQFTTQYRFVTSTGSYNCGTIVSTNNESTAIALATFRSAEGSGGAAATARGPLMGVLP